MSQNSGCQHGYLPLRSRGNVRGGFIGAFWDGWNKIQAGTAETYPNEWHWMLQPRNMTHRIEIWLVLWC